MAITLFSSFETFQKTTFQSSLAFLKFAQTQNINFKKPERRKRIQWKTTKVCIGLEMQLQQNK